VLPDAVEAATASATARTTAALMRAFMSISLALAVDPRSPFPRWPARTTRGGRD
jgi:hypothetical protein